LPANATTTEALWFIDTLAWIRVGGEESEGRIALVEMLGPRGHMPPLHLHRADDETFVLLEGEITLYVGDTVRRLRARDVAFAPKAVPHTFRIESETARWLVAATPAGFEHFVAAAGEPAGALELPQEPVLPDPDRFAAICAEFGIELLGPPGTLPS
jgi:quercetin dioxygenase-like cupin family protein